MTSDLLHFKIVGFFHSIDWLTMPVGSSLLDAYAVLMLRYML